MRNERRAFTLVELLVVIGIFAVLVALLFPAVSKAKEQALRTKCAANLRSIGHALIMYTQQSGYYPSFQGANGGVGPYAIWPTRLRALLGGDSDVFLCPSRDERFRWPRTGEAAPQWGVIVHATAVQSGFGYEIGEPLMVGTVPLWFSYGYNGWGVEFDGKNKGLGGVVYDVPIGLSPREMKANKVKSPSDMIAIGDSNGDGVFDTLINPKDERCFPGKLHNNGANILFCDGHVTWYPQRYLTPFYNPEGLGDIAWRQAQFRMWNNDNAPF